ncbi:MAG: SusD/RagB family nutrient-binding outer membrane lipoprotein [Flavobacteriaceae bacterium]|nr:SusD/RagB family nutrient-binding outer membrane lipoprotein [Flavobacteriaceae bacterium]
MKKYINKIALMLLAVVFSFSACDTVDFGDKNVNPNSPSNASTALLMTNAQRTVSGYISATTANLYVQYLSNGQYDEESRYQTLNWSPNYGVITNLNRIIELNENPDTKVAAQANGSNANQIAVANLLKSYYFNIMTDRWGMLPFSEANKGLDNPFPKYDTQQEIYNGIFAMIDNALSTMSSSNGPTGDILFGGNMATWAKFGNTLKMTMALRLAKADPATGKAKFLESYTKAISSVSENLKYTYLKENTNDNPWQDRFESRRDYLMSDTFVNKMIGAGTDTAPQDPRLAKMADVSNSTLKYAGAPYGASNSTVDNYSWITKDIIFKGDAPLMIFTYAEVCFARAEAGAGTTLNWTTDDPATWYANGIQASMDQWGVAAADATAYKATKPYVNESDIAYERWVAQFLQGYNSWADWRRAKAMNRDGKIALVAPASLVNGTDIPQRHGYAATAGSLNADNYQAALDAQGPDNLDTVLWINK